MIFIINVCSLHLLIMREKKLYLYQPVFQKRIKDKTKSKNEKGFYR